MTTFTIILILLLIFLILTLTFFALSSCLGSELRSAWGRRNRLPPTTYGLQYAQFMGQGGHGTHSEHIELENMLTRRDEGYD